MKKTHIIFVCSLLLCITSIGAYGVLAHIIKKDKNELLSLRDAMIEAEQQAHKEEALDIFLTKASEAQEIDNYFVHTDNSVDFISRLEHIGREVGGEVKINSVGIKESKDPLFESLAVELAIVGVYPDVLEYIELVEHLPYRMVIQSIAFSKETDGWEAVVSLDVTKIK